MLRRNTKLLRNSTSVLDEGSLNRRRYVHRLSKVFIPSGNVTQKSTDKGGGDGHELLLKAGFIRQASAGVFSLLPLGARVIEKLEQRIGHAMQSLGASKLSLPTLGTRALWEQSGRWKSSGAELFKLKDRKTAEFCLSPTHEESVTKLVASEVNGYKQLPVRVYQINRKFRDEMRPRGGLLRGKEFVMKDLYTFDDGLERAHSTYREVSEVYNSFFKTLGVPFYIAEADSGNIGGELSHEYHLNSKVGEDTLLACNKCSYVANQELAQTKFEKVAEYEQFVTHRFAHQIYRDSVFFDVEIPTGREVNMLQVLRLAQKIDDELETLIPMTPGFSDRMNPTAAVHKISSPQVMKVIKSDPCSKCDDGKLEEKQAIEIGHTFHLGTKYSKAMGFKYTSQKNEVTYPEMGCHGIGVTRLMAALAEIKHDEHGLNWPHGLAPFENALVVEAGFEEVADTLSNAFISKIDTIDDRPGKSVGYKVKDLQLAGIPRIAVIGKRFWINNPNLQRDHPIAPDQVADIILDEVQARGDSIKEWKHTTVGEWVRGNQK